MVVAVSGAKALSDWTYMVQVTQLPLPNTILGLRRLRRPRRLSPHPGEHTAPPLRPTCNSRAGGRGGWGQRSGSALGTRRAGHVESLEGGAFPAQRDVIVVHGKFMGRGKEGEGEGRRGRRGEEGSTCTCALFFLVASGGKGAAVGRSGKVGEVPGARREVVSRSGAAHAALCSEGGGGVGGGAHRSG